MLIRTGHTSAQAPQRVDANSRRARPTWNAFVERFQGTVLHLHDRVAFRYRSYVSVADIDADLQAWLRHSNFERPHRGYRTQSRRPAEIFYASRPDLLVEKGWDLHDYPSLTVRS